VQIFNTKNKTDKSKRRIVGFGRKVVTDKKSAQFSLCPFLIQPIIFFLFVLIFLLSEWIWLEKCCVRKYGLSDLSIPCQKLHKVLLPSQIICSVHTHKNPNYLRASPRAAAASTATLPLPPHSSCHRHCCATATLPPLPLLPPLRCRCCQRCAVTATAAAAFAFVFIVVVVTVIVAVSVAVAATAFS
jgi:hypothetical protein